MKILFITTISGSLPFCAPQIEMLIAQGNTVECACHRTGPISDRLVSCGCTVHEIGFSRSVLSCSNVKAYQQLRRLLMDGNYDLVHTHTPIASALARLACRKHRKRGMRVMYTAHGFHFYKGAPLKNWLLYYPIEKLCARWTDVLITINKEDFAFAKKKIKAKRVEYVPGVGIDIKKFSECNMDTDAKREQLGLKPGDIMLLSVGELNKNKNHEVILQAIAKLKNTNLHYFIAGSGGLKGYLENLALKLGISQQVRLLGFRRDISELLHAADIFCLPSQREGLPVSLMEAMTAGKPCVVSDVRGNVDLIGERECLCKFNHVSDFSSAIKNLVENPDLQKKLRNNNIEDSRRFDIKNILAEMKRIYLECFAEDVISDTGRSYDR